MKTTGTECYKDLGHHRKKTIKDLQVCCRTYKETIEVENILVWSPEKNSRPNIARKGVFNGFYEGPGNLPT